VFLTRRLLEVDSVFQVHADLFIAELERDSERAGGQQRTVGVELVAEVARFQALLEFGDLVCADGDDRKSQRCQFGFDLAQLTELRIAIGSPAAAVEDEQRAGFADEFREVDARSVQREDVHRGHGCARLQRPSGLCVRVDGVCRGCQARDQQQAGRPTRACACAEDSSGVEIQLHGAQTSTPGPGALSPGTPRLRSIAIARQFWKCRSRPG